ncbi:MAG: sulfide/dihydroorotate dehydrogenase-like FAD/NAD-binding protein, partial [Clostridiales bacterium]|nr:sulfide/dihydroorotate dehydrogenase-like FAD/NAD-binding protein [Clostridiales bacterium]
TMELNSLQKGECVHDFVGPLGVPTHTEGFKKVCIVGGGVGCAIAYPVAKKLRQQLCCVDTIIGFRTRNLVILRDEFSKISNELYLMTDDGTAGRSGLVTEMLETLLKMGKKYDEVIAIGPLPMMKYVCEVTKKYGIKTVVSMNPIMIDGTGMCGGCRLTVGGETKFACVDGPDFDGHLVDFDEAMARSSMYHEFEAHAREVSCHLLNKEVE